MISRVRIGLELGPSFIRGVRVEDRCVTKVFQQSVEKECEREGLKKCLDALGRDGSLRIVIRSLPLASTKLIAQAADELSSFSEHIPFSERDTAWEAIELEGDRTLLQAASRMQLEERLDAWGITAASAISPDAVALGPVALLALEKEMPAEGDFGWIDGERTLKFVRRSGRVCEMMLLHPGDGVAHLTGLGASADEATSRGAVVFRPGGADPIFAASWGATLWGTASFPAMPHLEPRDRREYRARARREARTHQRVFAAAAVMVCIAAGSYAYGGYLRRGAAENLSAANVKKAAVARRFDAVTAEVSARMPAAAIPGREIPEVLAAVFPHRADVELSECRWSAASGAYANLHGSLGEITLTGRASKLDVVEFVRAELVKTGRSVDITEATGTSRPKLPYDFRMKIQ